MAPLTTDNTDGGRYGMFNVVLSPTDATSGVAEIYYRIDGGSWQTGTSFTLRTSIRHKLRGLPPGDYVVEYRSTDNAGNVETPHGFTLTLY